MSGYISLIRLAVKDLYTYVQSLFKQSQSSNKYFLKCLHELEIAETLLHDIESSPTLEHYIPLLQSLAKKGNEAKDLVRKVRDPKQVYELIHRFVSYLKAAYYDITGKIKIVRKAFRMYIASFVIALILIPIFLRASIIFIGVLLFPMFISIHAFRARRKLGPLIASALLPIMLFIFANATAYSVYAISSQTEVEKIASVTGSIETAYLLVITILMAGVIGFAMSSYSYLVLIRHLDAFL